MVQTANKIALVEDEAWQVVQHTILNRRSNLRIDFSKEVSRDDVRSLIDLARWAPNHHRTNPWRIAVVSGTMRERLGAIALKSLLDQRIDATARLDKARSQFLRAPVVLVVGSSHHDDPELDGENRDAVAAGVQNMLLGATAMGMASAWKSGASALDPAIKRAVGFSELDRIVGFVYLGWPAAPAPAATREEPWVAWLDGQAVEASRPAAGAE